MSYKKELNLLLSKDIELGIFGHNKKTYNEYEQDTAVDTIHLKKTEEFFAFTLNNNDFYIDLTRLNVTNTYKAMEEDWVEEKTKLKDELLVSIKSVVRDENNKIAQEYQEKYKTNYLTKEDSVPEGLKSLITQLRNENKLKNLKPTFEMLEEEEQDFDIDSYDYWATKDDTIPINDIKFIPSKLLTKESLSNSISIDKLNELNFKSIKELNDVANNTKDRMFVFEKLNKYSNAVLPEMVYGLQFSKKVLNDFANKNRETENIQNEKNVKTKKRKNNLR